MTALLSRVYMRSVMDAEKIDMLQASGAVGRFAMGFARASGRGRQAHRVSLKDGCGVRAQDMMSRHWLNEVWQCNTQGSSCFYAT